ncbi:hypothetical protein [Acidianus sp. HS-5]|uniref:hypothetical protein n=1 Tax=Acidianus sp. HS-5 TaxID=2886040 RepID=UPI001F2A310E|nr:hypothetical protein [Acidianus sp. HS-5]BDC18411.1 hypothetical protein HS5_13010 [Acidianus sp. HS-5]
MSELDFLLNRKKGTEKKEEKNSTENIGNTKENREKIKEAEEKREDFGLKKEEMQTHSLESKKEEINEKKVGENIQDTITSGEKTSASSLESKEIHLDSRSKIEENKGNTLGEEEYKKKGESSEDSTENIMKRFLDKDPKIGVWSYPAYLVLQYLYNTKPGFKMSRIAKEALEYGLKNMYPDLFSKAEKISQLKQR